MAKPACSSCRLGGKITMVRARGGITAQAGRGLARRLVPALGKWPRSRRSRRSGCPAPRSRPPTWSTSRGQDRKGFAAGYAARCDPGHRTIEESAFCSICWSIPTTRRDHRRNARADAPAPTVRQPAVEAIVAAAAGIPQPWHARCAQLPTSTRRALQKSHTALPSAFRRRGGAIGTLIERRPQYYVRVARIPRWRPRRGALARSRSSRCQWG